MPVKILLAVALFGSLFLSPSNFAASGPQVLQLWPNGVPGSTQGPYPEGEVTRPDGVRRITNVTRPTLTVSLPDPAQANGTGIIICPGGGFRWLSIDNEGTELAKWLNARGVAAFVLKYRLVHTDESGRPLSSESDERQSLSEAKALAAADGQQAIRLVRSHAADWNVKSDRIGIIGFSAGGYVAAYAALHFDEDNRPNFAAPIYPATPDEINVPQDAPPIFLVQANDDKSVPVLQHSVKLYEAWNRAGIPAELHIYARGGHGFGMHHSGLPTETWVDRFGDWLTLFGYLSPEPPSTR